MKKVFTYQTFNLLDLKATLYPSKENKGLILYLHGGALIYGQRDDLPETYIEELTRAGYSLLSLDYPYIPEIKIDSIIDVLESGINNLKNLDELKEQNFDNLIYFGRSAGAFLALQLAASKKLTPPKKVISYYGYYSLEEPLLTQPSSYYHTFQSVPFMTAYSLIRGSVIAEAPIEERFQLYLSYRQTGTWVRELLGKKNQASDFSLSKEDLLELPPTFIAASSADQDVPFEINKKMANIVPNNQTFFVDNLPHDFDAVPTREAAIKCYYALINWLD